MATSKTNKKGSGGGKPSLASLIEEIRTCDREAEVLRDRRARLVACAQARKGSASKVLARFVGGDYVVVSSGRHFWCRDGGLIAAVTSGEMTGLAELTDMGVLALETGARAV